jgi:dipeptidase E
MQQALTRLYLSGGGDEKQSFPLDKLFFETIPKNGCFLYIPIALRGHTLYTTASSWMKQVLLEHGREDIVCVVADDLSTIQEADMALYHAAYIGGGDTWSLVQECVDSGFSTVLARYAENGGVVYGGSAGAIMLGARLDTHHDKNEVGYTKMEGLSLLGAYSVACHVVESELAQYALWAKEHEAPLLCLSEETGLVVLNNHFECVGAQSCVVYDRNGERTDIAPNESLSL